jgi:hypothetical protein
MPPDSQEQLAKEQFKDAVDDSELRSAIFRAKPRNLEEAVSAAIETECFLKAEKARYKGKSGYSRMLDALDPEQDQRLTQVESQVKEVGTQMQHMLQVLQSIQNEIQPQPVSQAQNVNTPGRKRGNQSSGCFYCGKPGHFKGKCYKFQKEDPEGYRRYCEARGQGNESGLSQGAREQPRTGDTNPQRPLTGVNTTQMLPPPMGDRVAEGTL